MNVISRKKIIEFYSVHSDSREALETWYRICRRAEWSNFTQVREVFSSADWVGDDRMIFNIKGNKYRVVARVSFRYKSMQIKWLGTHAQYDSIDPLKVG
ncbi:MAG: type II toxin-antitoxin system HigB family toxin [Bacteroidota bacterium]|nr:type II toxin-antitoxin system HigB family toxin [Bacteroidota bacterium]MCA4898057.1 type II toxin-antitoxin system HigB family toxin [Cytophagales bacterium]